MHVCHFCPLPACESTWQSRVLVYTCAEHSLKLFGPVSTTLPQMMRFWQEAEMAQQTEKEDT